MRSQGSGTDRLPRTLKSKSHENSRPIDKDCKEKLKRQYITEQNAQDSSNYNVSKCDSETGSCMMIEFHQEYCSSKELQLNTLERELNTVFGCPSGHSAMNVKAFLDSINHRPFYICTCCNRMLDRKTVRKFHSGAYALDIFTSKRSFDNQQYICNTCHSKVKKGKTPCQEVCNKLVIDEVPSELESLRKLESVLIAQRIVFQKIIIRPKEQHRKIKGAICNIPVDCETVCRSLPRPSEQSGIILLKLKRKLQYSGHQYCETVRPDCFKRCLTVSEGK